MLKQTRKNNPGSISTPPKFFRSASLTGFTVLELLVVISVTALISSILMVVVSKTRVWARDSRRISEVTQIQKAIELYRLNNADSPPGTEGNEYVSSGPNWIPGLAPGQINVVPSDPLNVDPHMYHYKRTGTNYEISTRLENDGSKAAAGDGGSGGSLFYEQGTQGNLIGKNGGGWSGQTIALTANKISGVVPLEVNFTATLYNFLNCGNTYVWNFGEGPGVASSDTCAPPVFVMPSQTRINSHIYSSPGTFTVTYTVNGVISNSVIIGVTSP